MKNATVQHWTGIMIQALKPGPAFLLLGEVSSVPRASCASITNATVINIHAYNFCELWSTVYVQSSDWTRVDYHKAVVALSNWRSPIVHFQLYFLDFFHTDTSPEHNSLLMTYYFILNEL